MDAQVRLLLQIIDQGYEKRAWHGTTLRGSLRGVDVETALWRPAPTRHNVWELLLHAAYWKYIVRRHLTGDRTLAFPRKPSNWPRPPAPGTVKELKADIGLLGEEHRTMREAVRLFPAARLHRRPTARGPTYATLIHGIAAHDLYHTGQIQLLKRLRRGS